MTRTLIVAGLCAVALAGCGKTVVRETVVERPVVKETVIERAPVAVAAAPLSCSIAGAPYAHGALTCQASYQHRCNNGVWERIAGSVC